MLSRSEGVPSNFGVQVLDRLKVGLGSLGNNAEVGVMKTGDLNPIEFERRVLVFIGKAEPILFRVGENKFN